MKRIQNNDFLEEIEIYTGFKDYFGNPVIVLVDTVLGELRTVAKSDGYVKRRRNLDNIKLNHVIIPKYESVIDFTAKQAENIKRQFPGLKYPVWQIWE